MIQEFPNWLPSVREIPVTPVNVWILEGNKDFLITGNNVKELFWTTFILYFVFLVEKREANTIRGQTMRIENYSLTGLGFFREFAYKIESQALE